MPEGIGKLPPPAGYVLGGGSLGAVQAGLQQAPGTRDIAPDVVTGISVGSLNGAVVTLDPEGAADRLSRIRPRITRDWVFPHTDRDSVGGGPVVPRRAARHRPRGRYGSA